MRLGFPWVLSGPGWLGGGPPGAAGGPVVGLGGGARTAAQNAGIFSVPPAAALSRVSTAASTFLPWPFVWPACHASHSPCTAGSAEAAGEPGAGAGLADRCGVAGRVGVPCALLASGTGTPNGVSRSCAPCWTPAGRVPVPAATATPPSDRSARTVIAFTARARDSHARSRPRRTGAAGPSRHARAKAATAACRPASSSGCGGAAASSSTSTMPARSARLDPPESSSSASRRPIRRARKEIIAPVRAIREPTALHPLRLRGVERPRALLRASRHPGEDVRMVGQPAQAPHRGDAHRSRALTQYLCALRDVEPGHHPQHHRLRLVAGQRADHLQRPSGTQLVERLGGAVRRGRGGLPQRGVVRVLGPPSQPPAVVDAPVPRDAEQPHPEPGQTTIEGAQVAGCLQPGLRGHVLGGVADDHPQVPEYGRLERQPQRLEPRLVAAARGDQGVREVAAIHLTDPVTPLHTGPTLEATPLLGPADIWRACRRGRFTSTSARGG